MFFKKIKLAFSHKAALSLVHTVPVYAPVRPGSLQQADRGEREQIGTEFECVHIFPAVLRTRPGLGQKLIRVCPGNATVHSRCSSGGATEYGVSRCVPIHHGFAPGIGGRAPVSLRRVTKVGRQSPGVSR